MTFNEKLIKLRKANAWSQEDLAEKIDVSRQSISKWELGDTTPDSDKIVALSNLFSVTTDYLLKEDIDDNPTTTVIMRSDPNKNITIGKNLKFLSTFFYAIGLLIAWTIWAAASDDFIYDSLYNEYTGPYNMGSVAILVGALIQCAGIACYYFSNKFHKSKLSLGQIFLNFLFLHYMPLSGIFSVCIFGAVAPYPYFPTLMTDRYDMALIISYIIHFVVVAIVGFVFYVKYKKQKKLQKEQKQE